MVRRVLLSGLLAVTTLSGCKKDKPAEGAAGAGGDKTAAAAKPPEKPAEKPVEAAADAKAAPESCNSDFKQPIEVAYTLTKKCSPYTLDTDLYVRQDLTIEPGVTVKLGANGNIRVGQGQKARITAKGTAEEPIKFVSAGRQEAGFWGFVYLGEDSDGSAFEHVHFENGGSYNDTFVEARAEDVTIKNCRFVGAKKFAIVQYDGNLSELSGNDFSGASKHPLILKLRTLSANAVKADNKFGEGHQIELDGNFEKDATLLNPGVPYFIPSDLYVGNPEEGQAANVVIEAGVTVKFADNVSMRVGQGRNGSLKVNGTAEKPVLLTSAAQEPEAGGWSGIYFESDSVRAPSFSHATVEYAGQKNEAAIRLSHDKKSAGKFQNVTVRKSAGAAIKVVYAASSFEAFTGNKFEDIAESTLILPPHLASGLGEGNTYPANGKIELQGERLETDTTFPAQPVPYFVADRLYLHSQSDSKTATLTIAPGATLEFGGESAIHVGRSYPGVLKAVGTAEKPVKFTAVGDAWQGITLESHGKAQIENAVFEKVAAERPAVQVDDGSAGSVKQTVFKEMEVGVKNCSTKFTLEQNKGENTKTVETKDGC